MSSRSAKRQEALIAVSTFSAVLIVVDSGWLSLVGWLLAGALMGSWAYTFVRAVCAMQPIQWPQLARAACCGALVMPCLAVVARLGGSGVWLIVGGGAVAWAMLVTPTGRVPPRVREHLGTVKHLTLRLRGSEVGPEFNRLS